MGRKRKFGEESAWVSVRVPRSKVKEYRDAVREFVEEKFALELALGEKSTYIRVQVPKSRVKELKQALKEFIR